MREEIKKKDSPKDTLINEIIEIEWSMFDQVKNAGGRAGCQDDDWTFYAMRYSQHNAFSWGMLQSYRKDLDQALREGRNLLTEKYAYMMEFTEPDYFDKNLKPHLPQIAPEKAELVDRIANLSIKYQQEFERVYPAFSKAGRPLTGMAGAEVSLHIYTIGELKTYSVRTLQLYLRDMQVAGRGPENTAFAIHRMTAEFYGYGNLEQAEKKLRSQRL